MSEEPLRLGVKAIDVGFRILKALAEEQRTMSLTEIAQATAMSPSKAHRYLLSLIRVGAAGQDPATRRYSLGSFALQMGLSAVAQADDLRQAVLLSTELRDAIGQTIVLTVWGQYGPTIVRIEESSQSVQVTMRVGTVLPLINTAAGRVFAAYLPTQVIEPLVLKQIEASGQSIDGAAAKLEEFRLKIGEVRRARLAVSVGEYAAGIATMATPLFTPDHRLVAVIAAMGQCELLNCAMDSSVARALKRVAAAFAEGSCAAAPWPTTRDTAGARSSAS